MPSPRWVKYHILGLFTLFSQIFHKLSTYKQNVLFFHDTRNFDPPPPVKTLAVTRGDISVHKLFSLVDNF